MFGKMQQYHVQSINAVYFREKGKKHRWCVPLKENRVLTRRMKLAARRTFYTFEESCNTQNALREVALVIELGCAICDISIALCSRNFQNVKLRLDFVEIC